MLKKTLLSIGLAGMLFAGQNVSVLKQAYNQGIYDTLKVLQSENKFGYNQKMTLNGYMVYINTANLTLPQIVKYKALALKLAFTPIETSNGLLIFAVNSRKPDAFMNAQIIANSSNLHPEIKKVTDYVVTYSGVLQRYFKNKLPDKVFVIEEQRTLKPYQCMNQKPVTASGKFYIINRVLSPAALKLYCHNNPAKCKPKINVNKKETQETLHKIKRTLMKKDFSLKNKTFNETAGIIARYGVVKNGVLYLGKKTYKPGDKVGNYYLIAIAKGEKGAVIVIISPVKNPKSAKDFKRIKANNG